MRFFERRLACEKQRKEMKPETWLAVPELLVMCTLNNDVIQYSCHLVSSNNDSGLISILLILKPKEVC